MAINEKLTQLFEYIGYQENEYRSILEGKFSLISHMDSETLYEHVKNTAQFLFQNGYTREDFIDVTCRLPIIFQYSLDTIANKINDIVNLGYTKEEVIDMTKKFPWLFTLSIEAIKQKIDYYDSIGLHEMIVSSPDKLMQSIEHINARNMYLSNIGEEIDMTNYEKLFMKKEQFRRTYKVDERALLARYDYGKIMEEKNGRAI